MSQYPRLVFPHELPYQNTPISTDQIYMERGVNGVYTTYGTCLSSLSAAGLIGYSGMSGYSGYSGMATIITNVAQANHNFTVGTVIRSLSAGAYTAALADNATNAEAVGIVTQVVDPNNFVYTQYGPTTTGVPADAANTALFLSDTVAGLLTAVEPTAVGHVSKPMAIVLYPSVLMEVLNMRGMIIGASTTFGQITLNNANTPYTMTGVDYFIDMDASVSPLTAILPSAVNASGKEYAIKKIDNTYNSITILTTSGQTIDGQDSI
jgi:hypothetical protein